MPSRRGPLFGFRVVDLTDEFGILATRLFAGLGAEVIRLEPPSGDRLRLRPPVVAGDSGQDVSAYWLHMNAAKRSVMLDLDEPGGLEALRSLLRTADVLFESGARSRLEELGLGWMQLQALFPDLVYTSISTFGRRGPKADWTGGDLIAMAAGGLLYLCGEPDRAPLRITAEQSAAQASVQALAGTLIALAARRRGAAGQLVDVSMQEAIVNTLGNAQLVYQLDGQIYRRSGTGRAASTGATAVRNVWECSDGYISWGRNPASIQPLHRWMVDEGLNPVFDSELWAWRPSVGSEAPPVKEVKALEEEFMNFFRRYPKAYLYEEGQRRGTMICPVSDVSDLVSHAQLRNRRFFHDVAQAELGRSVVQTGSPFVMSASKWQVAPAPALGEHTDEIIAPLRSAPDGRRREARPEHPRERDGAPLRDSRRILDGLRVVDFSWVGVGPMATQTLALFGAEVIRVESARRLDGFRSGTPLAPGDGPDRSAYWANVNRDKLGMTLDLRHERAREVVERLVRRADVVTESFSPGFMATVGFDYDRLRDIKPDLLMLSMSMEGQTGPHAQFKGYGSALQATAGITALTGWLDRPPVGTGVAYTDWFATHLAVISLLAALEYRHVTGEGQYIDLSQLESAVWALDDAIPRFAATGEVMKANANRHRWAAPHGVFPCRGDDRWCAISVFNDDQWDHLTEVMGRPPWADDTRFESMEARKQHEDAIERQLAEWTAGQDSKELATRLQAVGVPAHHVSDARDLHEDAQLIAREHFWEVAHPVIGRMLGDAPAFRLSATPAYPARPAPLLGEHNEYVCRELLSFTEEEFIQLMVDRVLD